MLANEKKEKKKKKNSCASGWIRTTTLKPSKDL